MQFTTKILIILAGFIMFSFVTKTMQAQSFTVSGTAYYSDLSQRITSGSVNAYDQNQILMASTAISPDGSFIFRNLNGGQYDLIIIANDELGTDRFIPTYFPDKTSWLQATVISVYNDISGINIYAKKLTGGAGGAATSSSISGNVTVNSIGVSNAIVYAKQGDNYYGYAISDSKGNYKIISLPEGDYILVVERIGDYAKSTNITVDTKGAEQVNFDLKVYKNGKVNDIVSNPVEFKLSQNFPNPFNPSTVISYVVPKDGSVSLKVYNSLGGLVTNLINTDQKAGAYAVNFDGTNLSSGIYFYTIETAGLTATKRMVLVK